MGQRSEQLIGLGDDHDGRARLRGALVKAIDKMNETGDKYVAALVLATNAEIAYRQSQEYLTVVEDAARSDIVATLTGKNEAQRHAETRFRMTNHPTVGACRIDVSKAQNDRDEAKTKADGWDVRQKMARAEVAALTAIVAGM